MRACSTELAHHIGELPGGAARFPLGLKYPPTISSTMTASTQNRLLGPSLCFPFGSAHMVTNATGQILDDSDFYPFGGERIVVNNDPNPYKFTGKERDGESGLDNFGARYFASTLGRFQSPDPGNASGFTNLDDPQSWSGYAYARNNPLNAVDPHGEDYYLIGGAKCGGEVQCDDEGFVVDDDGNRVVITDEQIQNGDVTLGVDPFGNYTITTEQGTFYAVFFDPAPATVWVIPDPLPPGVADTLYKAGTGADAGIKAGARIMAENAAFAGLGAGLGVVGEIVGPRLLQLGVSGRILKVVVNVVHAANTGHLSVPVQKAARAVEQAIFSGKYRVVTEGSQTLLRGEVVVDGVRVGFKGKVIDGTARVATMFDLKGTP